MIKKVGFIGLGQMGKWMALNLVRNQFDLTVFDTNARATEFLVEQGAKPAQNARQLARHVDVIVLSLPNADVVTAVALGDDGIVHGAGKGQILVDCGTSGFLQTKVLAKKLEKGERMRFKLGATSLLFVNLRERNVLQAAEGWITAMADYQKAQAFYQWAIGAWVTAPSST